MIEPSSNDTLRTSDEQGTEEQATAVLDWETPRLEDVSEQVMAQPYIRFT